MDTDELRQVRIAENQDLFREVNARIDDLTVANAAEYICECADDSCFKRVRVTHDDYEAIRANPRRFFVAPGGEHVFPEAERIVSQQPDYWIVEKAGTAGDVAAAHAREKETV